MSCYLFKEGLIFLAFTLKLMLQFIMINMSNSKVYFMKQNASAPDGKVSAPEGHLYLVVWPAPIATRSRL